MTLAPSLCVRRSVRSLVLIAAVAVSVGCPAKAPEPAAAERPAGYYHSPEAWVDVEKQPVMRKPNG